MTGAQRDVQRDVQVTRVIEARVVAPDAPVDGATRQAVLGCAPFEGVEARLAARAQLGVPALRRALRALQAEGLAWWEPGSGRVVLDVPRRGEDSGGSA